MNKNKDLKRFYDLYIKRSLNKTTILEEEELIKLSNNISSEELEKIDKKFLSYSLNEKTDRVINKLDQLLEKINNNKTKSMFKTLDLDSRSIFANYVCKLAVKSHNNNVMLAMKDLKETYDFFFDHVRNIYELVRTEIPLFFLYEISQEDTCEEWLQEISQEYYDNISIEELKAKVLAECQKIYCE